MNTATLTQEEAQLVMTVLNETTVNGLRMRKAIAILQSALDAPAQPEQDVNAELIKALISILEMTDPDNSESYRADDSEGCLDTVFSISSSAIANAQASEAETPEQHLQHIAEFGELQNQAPARELSDAIDALKLAMSWIDNWDPSFTKDVEWAADSVRIRAVLAASKAKLNYTDADCEASEARWADKMKEPEPLKGG